VVGGGDGAIKKGADSGGKNPGAKKDLSLEAELPEHEALPLTKTNKRLQLTSTPKRGHF
jgi:hypothetical protein